MLTAAIRCQWTKAAIKPPHQLFTLVKEVSALEFSVFVKGALMQVFKFYKGLFQVAQVLAKHRRTNANACRALRKKGLNLTMMTRHKLSLGIAQRFKRRINFLRGLHQQCLFASALRIARIAEDNQLPRFGEIGELRIKASEFLQHRRLWLGKQY